MIDCKRPTCWNNNRLQKQSFWTPLEMNTLWCFWRLSHRVGRHLWPPLVNLSLRAPGSATCDNIHDWKCFQWASRASYWVGRSSPWVLIMKECVEIQILGNVIKWYPFSGYPFPFDLCRDLDTPFMDFLKRLVHVQDIAIHHKKRKLKRKKLHVGIKKFLFQNEKRGCSLLGTSLVRSTDLSHFRRYLPITKV